MVIKKTSGQISETTWRKVVNSSPYIVSLREHEGVDFDVYGYAILKIEGKIYGRLLWNWDVGAVGVEVRSGDLPQTYQALQQIAAELGGRLFINRKEPFDPQKHLPIPAIAIDRSHPHFANSELEELRWMALRSTSQDAVLQALHLSKQREGELEDLLGEEGYVLTTVYEGWVFVMGDTLPDLFLHGNEQSSREALEQMSKSLQRLSKIFGAAQYFEYSDRSSVSGYFSANNGKLIYGYWQSELEEFTKGRPPKAIKHLHPANPHEVAAVWSIDPMDFVYLKAFAEENAYLAEISREAPIVPS